MLGGAVPAAHGDMAGDMAKGMAKGTPGHGSTPRGKLRCEGAWGGLARSASPHRSAESVLKPRLPALL